MGLYHRLMILLLVISSSILAGCGPLLIADTRPTIYVAKPAPPLTVLPVFDEELSRSLRLVASPRGADYVVAISSSPFSLYVGLTDVTHKSTIVSDYSILRGDLATITRMIARDIIRHIFEEPEKNKINKTVSRYAI